MPETDPKSQFAIPGDSAGVPWQGRHFEDNLWRDDDGSAPPAVAAVLAEIARGQSNVETLLAALAGTRLLVPLLAELGEAEIGPHGQKVDKSADLSIVAVATPDQATAIPAFTDVSSMRAWNRDARPVPVAAARLAVAAAGEGHTRVIINPATDKVGLRFPQLKALASETPWANPANNSVLVSKLQDALGSISNIVSFELVWADPLGTLLKPEFELQLWILAGLNSDQLNQTLNDVTQAFSQTPEASLIDSYGLKLLAAPTSANS